MGAEAYGLAGLHLYTPLPFRPGRGGFGDLFRTHFFVNAGNLTNIDFGEYFYVLQTIAFWDHIP
jgi:outer membrane protein insertion porin family